MKVKKIIKDNWKLESKDNIDSIKEQLSFNEQAPNFIQQYKYKMIFSVVSCILIVCLFIASGMFVGGGFDGNLSDDPSNPMSPAPDAPQDPSFPGENEDSVKPEEPSSPEGNEKPESGDDHVYNLFIEELKNNVIVSDYVNFIKYDNENIEDNEKIKVLCEFFNNLSYEDIDEENIIYEHKISFNDWASIEINESSNIRIIYQDVIISYNTNNPEILEEVNKILK